MRRLFMLALACLVATVAGADPNRRSRNKPDEGAGRPALRLSASPRHGYPPLRVTLSAHLKGVEPDNAAFCHAGVEWESRSPGGIVTISREEPRCLHPADQINIQASFVRVVVLERGIFSYRAILHTKDGGRLISPSVEINVIPR